MLCDPSIANRNGSSAVAGLSSAETQAAQERAGLGYFLCKAPEASLELIFASESKLQSLNQNYERLLELAHTRWMLRQTYSRS
jgi:hypothetical protein